MNRNISERVLEEAEYIIKNNDTVRKLSKHFKVSKSTVHKDLHDRLKKVNKELFKKVEIIFKNNYKEKHIRGGEATKLKYLNLSANNQCCDRR